MHEKTPPQARHGRPTKLNAVSADTLVTMLAAGATVTDAAAAIGVTPRSVQGWRRRAYSRDPRDAPFVELERRISAARLQAARALPPPGPSWREAAAALEANFPERWALNERQALSEIDDLLAKIPTLDETLAELEALPSIDELLADLEDSSSSG